MVCLAASTPRSGAVAIPTRTRPARSVTCWSLLSAQTHTPPRASPARVGPIAPWIRPRNAWMIQSTRWRRGTAPIGLAFRARAVAGEWLASAPSVGSSTHALRAATTSSPSACLHSLRRPRRLHLCCRRRRTHRLRLCRTGFLSRLRSRLRPRPRRGRHHLGRGLHRYLPPAAPLRILTSTPATTTASVAGSMCSCAAGAPTIVGGWATAAPAATLRCKHPTLGALSGPARWEAAATATPTSTRRTPAGALADATPRAEWRHRLLRRRQHLHRPQRRQRRRPQHRLPHVPTTRPGRTA